RTDLRAVDGRHLCALRAVNSAGRVHDRPRARSNALRGGRAADRSLIQWSLGAMIRNRTAILVLLTGLNLLNYIDRFVMAAVLKKVKAPIAEGGLDLSNSEAGLLATAFLLGYFVTSPLFGARADKGARKGLIALGVGVWSLATVLTGLADSFALLVAARVVVGIGEASYATLAPTIIDDLTPPAQKGR